MNHIIDNTGALEAKPGANVPVHPMVIEAFRLIPLDILETLFTNLRLNVQGRIRGLSQNDDFLKLQGKLDLLDELKQFFRFSVK